MPEFKADEQVLVRGSVLRLRAGLVEIQLRDGQLLRAPIAHVEAAGVQVMQQSEQKPVRRAPEDKGLKRAPEQKAAAGRETK